MFSLREQQHKYYKFIGTDIHNMFTVNGTPKAKEASREHGSYKNMNAILLCKTFKYRLSVFLHLSFFYIQYKF